MSRAALEYPGRGNHFFTVAEREFLGMDGYWYRVEVWHEEKSELLRVSGYRRERGHWLPHYSVQLGMEKDALLRGQLELKEAA